MSGVQRNVCAETKERSGRRVPAGAVAIINKKSYQNKCSPPVLKESFLPPLQRASFEAAAAAAAAASSSSNSALSSSAEEHSRPSSEQRMSDQTTLKMPDLAEPRSPTGQEDKRDNEQGSNSSNGEGINDKVRRQTQSAS